MSAANNQRLIDLLQFITEAHFWAMFASVPEALEGSKDTICYASKLLEIVAYISGVRRLASTQSVISKAKNVNNTGLFITFS